MRLLVSIRTYVFVKRINKTTDYKSHNRKLTDQNRNTRRHSLWGSPARTINPGWHSQAWNLRRRRVYAALYSWSGGEVICDDITYLLLTQWPHTADHTCRQLLLFTAAGVGTLLLNALNVLCFKGYAVFCFLWSCSRLLSSKILQLEGWLMVKREKEVKQKTEKLHVWHQILLSKDWIPILFSKRLHLVSH